MLVVVALSVLVIIHELGHFLAAKWAKVVVQEFGIGYPPRILTLFTKWQTVFSLNAIPIGGFVKMEGEDATNETPDKLLPHTPAAFYAKTAWQRMIVIIAGPVANLLLGIIIFSVIFSITGIPQPVTTARIGAIQDNSPAQTAGVPTEVNLIGLQLDQTLIPISTPQEMIDQVQLHSGEVVTLVTTGTCQGMSCAEQAQYFEVYIRTPAETPAGMGSVGLVFESVVLVRYPWYQMPIRSVVYGIWQTYQLSVLILQALGQMVLQLAQGVVPQEVAGPVGIVHQTNQEALAQQGWLAMLSFTGMLSVNLGLINLLPIPALDGGRLALLALEQVIGKRTVARFEGRVNYFGYVALLALIGLITLKDIWGIVF